MNENKETVIMELHENELTEMISINVICRLCANQNDKLIGIYSEDGINNDLANKMNMYLPVKVNETDDLPLQCCWQCASTVLAWHDLVITSVEADRRLRSYQFVSEKQLHDVQVNFQAEESCHSSEKQNEVETDHASLNAFCQADPNTQTVVEKIKDPKRTIESDFVASGNDNLSDFANIEPQYLQLNNDLYDIKMEEKNLEAKENMELPQIYQGTDDSSSDNNGKEDTAEESQPMYNYGCQYCPMMFLSEEDIINHITEAHPDSDFKVDALSQEALQSLKKKRRKNNKIDQDLVNSAKVVVDGRIYYNCKECGKSLHSPYTYVWHMRIHTGERPYVCDLCGKQFRVSQGLVRHLKETHARIKNFACDLCGRMFATRRNVEEHRRIHTNERPYVCDLCGKSFKQKASLFVHNRSHTDTFPFKCTYCSQAFRTKPPLLIHVTKHTGEKPYPCDVCGRCFRIKYELKRHRLIHSDEKPFLCTTCGLSFRQKRYLRNHNKLNHTVQFQIKLEDVKECLIYDNISEGENSTLLIIDKCESPEPTTALKEPLHICDLCLELFDTKLLLKKHMKDIHDLKLPKYRRKKSEIDASFTCPTCGKCYTRNFDMQKHIKSKHLNQRNEILPSNRDKNSELLERCKVSSSEGVCYKCDICGRLFRKSHTFVRHRHIHPDSDFKVDGLSQEALQSVKKQTKNNKIDQDLVNAAKVVVDGKIYYNCKECGKSLRTPYTYVGHMRIHTGERPYVCDLCGKQFRTSQGLDRHLRETHARIKNFACDLCGRMFATRQYVEEHRRIHTNERPYVCALCGKSFRQRSSLFVHNRWSHTDTFPFKCTYCSQAFRTKPSLLVHVTKHTGEKPYRCDVCGRCFRINYHLKQHSLTHSDKKSFLCTTCGLGFKLKRYLRKHNRLNHTAQ